MADYPVIQNKVAHSWPEVYIAYALEKYDIPFYFQYEIGRARLRGGIIVDFVLVNPWKQPVEIFGEYWHRSSAKPDEKMRLAIIEQYFGRECIVVNATDVDTQDKADQYVKEHFL